MRGAEACDGCDIALIRQVEPKQWKESHEGSRVCCQCLELRREASHSLLQKERVLWSEDGLPSLRMFCPGARDWRRRPAQARARVERAAVDLCGFVPAPDATCHVRRIGLISVRGTK